MFLFRALWWLVSLPFRLVLFLLGLAVWVLMLPLRIVFGLLGFIGFGRILQVGVVGLIGYFLYRLVNEAPPSDGTNS